MSTNWISCLEKSPWKFQFLFNEIKTWSSSLNFEFCHVLRSRNGMANALTKLEVERDIAFACSFVICCFMLVSGSNT